MDFKVNSYQTQLTQDLLDSLEKEVAEDLLDAITNIEFIKRLVSPDRKRAKDLDRDDKGRIVVDLVRPHIIEDMEYFRPTGNYFRKHGVLTQLRPNPNPNSEFKKWLDTETDRCWHGMVRESDGEWVTGDMYFYLNYVPILQSKAIAGSRRAQRIYDFPECWEATYLWFHYVDQARSGGVYDDFAGGSHCVHIARRGIGKSFSSAAMLAKLFIVGESLDVKRANRGVAVSFKSEYLTKDGILNKFVDAIDFCAEYTHWPHRRLKSSMQEMLWKMGYLDGNTGVMKGTLNEVIGVTTKDDSDKVRGKRAQKIIYEEFGANPNFLETWNTTIPSVQEGDFAFGQLLAQGTGGSEGSDFTGALEIIYNPLGYNVYPLPNVFDRNSQGKNYTVFFSGGYMNRKGFYNKDGVSDVVGALISILKDRFTLKYNSTDPTAITRRKAEIPITIQDAIMQITSTIYPVADLTDRLNQIDLDPSSLDDVLVGELGFKNGEVSFKPSIDNDPIRYYPHKDNKQDGAVEIFKMPELDNTGKAFRGRYILGADTFDDDHSNTLSLGAVKVLDLWTDKLVAQYTGRRQFADEFFEICRRLTIFYNGELLYENNKKGMFGYFQKMNSLYLLADVPEYLRDKDLVKGELYGNKVKGSPSTAPIKGHGRTLLRDWLLKPQNDVVFDDDGNSMEVTFPLLMTLKSRSLIQELTLWNSDANFDEHDAMVMLMLLRQERLILHGEDGPSEKSHVDDSSYIGNDPFFTKNYDDRFEDNSSSY